MNAVDDAREELEAALWRIPGATAALVDAALSAADRYADATAEAEGARRLEEFLERLRAARGTRRELAPCGTVAAARRHRRHGEPVDEACLKAESADRREYLQAQMARARARTGAA